MFKIDKVLISLDQARELAWSVFDIENDKLISYDMDKFPSGKKIYKDYDDFIYYAKIRMGELIDEYKPVFVTLEGVQMQSNKAVYAKLSRLQGVLINYLKEKQINYKIIPPVTWKSDLKISQGRKTNRKIEKENSIKFVKERFNIDTNDNIADAICMGVYILKKYEKDELIGSNR